MATTSIQTGQAKIIFNRPNLDTVTSFNGGIDAAFNSYSFSHTVSGGNYLVLAVDIGNPKALVSGVTYNGMPLTHLIPPGTGNYQLLGLLNPDQGTHDIIITLPVEAGIVAAAASYKDVNSTIPVGSGLSVNGTGTIVSMSLPTVVGDLVVGMAMNWNGGYFTSSGINQIKLAEPRMLHGGDWLHLAELPARSSTTTWTATLPQTGQWYSKAIVLHGLVAIISKSQLGKSRITQTSSKTQSGKSRIKLQTSQTTAGVANIKNTTNRTQSGRTRIPSGKSLPTFASVAGTTAFTESNNSITFSATVASGDNRYLIVEFFAEQVASLSYDVSSVTYNGVSMTRLGNQSHYASEYRQIWMYGITAPAVGTYDVVITFTIAGLSGSGAALAFTGVDQTTPTGQFVGAAPIYTNPLQLSLSSSYDELVVDIADYYNYTLTPGSNQIQLFSVTSNNYNSFGSRQAGAPTVTMVWNHNSSVYAAIGAITLKPVITTNSQTQAGRSRITCFTSKPQFGKTRVTNTTIQIQSGRSSIFCTTTRSEYGQARIGLITIKTILGYSNIINTVIRTHLAKAAILNGPLQSQEGLSRIAVPIVSSQTQDGISRILPRPFGRPGFFITSNPFEISGSIDDFEAGELNSVLIGVGSILKSTDREQSGQAYINLVSEQTSNGVAAILKANDQIIPGQADILQTNDQVSTGVGTISNVTDQEITGISRIVILMEQTIDGLASVVNYKVTSIDGIGNIFNYTEQSTLGLSAISDTYIQNQSGKSFVVFVKTKNILGAFKIINSSQRTITGRSGILGTTTRTQYGVSSLHFLTERLQYGQSRILVSINRSIVAKADIYLSTDQVQFGNARIKVSVNQTQTGITKIVNSNTQTVSGKADILLTHPFLVSDDFNRSDEALLTNGRGWENLQNGSLLSILSQSAIITTSYNNAAYVRRVEYFPPDQYARADVKLFSFYNDMRLVVRSSGQSASASYYYVSVGGPLGNFVYKIVNGVGQQLGTNFEYPGFFSNGNSAKLEVTGQAEVTLRVYRNDIKVFEIQDTNNPILFGKPGFGSVMTTVSNFTYILDNFSAGSLAGRVLGSSRITATRGQTIYENFNRPDGIFTDDFWLIQGTPPEIVNGILQPFNKNFDAVLYNLTTVSQNQFVEIVLANTVGPSSRIALMLCRSESNYYQFVCDGYPGATHTRLEKAYKSDGNWYFPEQANSNETVTIGDTVRFSVINRLFTVYKNGTPIITWEDTNSYYPPAGWPGFYIQGDSVNYSAVDNFACGDTTTPIRGGSRITIHSNQSLTGQANIYNTSNRNVFGKTRVTTTVERSKAGRARIKLISTAVQYGQGRIKTRVLQTTNGKGRITVFTAKILYGKTRIQATTDHVKLGLSRIQLRTTQPQTGLSALIFRNAQSVFGKSRITVIPGKTQLGKTRIKVYVIQDQFGSALVERAFTKTQIGRARVTTSTDKLRTGKSRIRIHVVSNQLGLSRIGLRTSQTELGKSRIEKAITRTLTGKSRVRVTVVRDKTGSARIKVRIAQPIIGRGNILVIRTRTIVGKTRICVTNSVNRLGKSRIKVRVSEIQYGKSLITGHTSKIQYGKSRIEVSVVRNQSAKSRIRITQSVDRFGCSRIKVHVLQVGQGKANLTRIYSKALTGRSRIQTTNEKARLGKSRIKVRVLQIQNGLSEILNHVNKIQTGKTDILISVDKARFGKSRIRIHTIQDKQGITRIKVRKTESILGQSNIFKIVTFQIQAGLSRITKRSTRAQYGKTNLTRVVVKTRSGKSRIRISVSQNTNGQSTIVLRTSQTQFGVTNIYGLRRQFGKASILIINDQIQNGIATVIPMRNVQTQLGKSSIFNVPNEIIRGKAYILFKRRLRGKQLEIIRK